MAIFTTFGKQKDDKSTLFTGGVSVKFWKYLLGLAYGKMNSTPTHKVLHIMHGVYELRNYFVDFWSVGREF